MEEERGKKAFNQSGETSSSYQVVQVSGASMWPYLKPGDFLVVDSNTQTQDYGPGEILGFTTEVDDEISFHRLIESAPLAIKGDAVSRRDQFFYEKVQVVSRAEFRLIQALGVMVPVRLKNSALSPLYRGISRLSLKMDKKSRQRRRHSFTFISLLSLGFITRGLEYSQGLCQAFLKRLR